MSDMTTASDDHQQEKCSQRGSGQCPEICFWVVFAIFSGLLKIIPVLGIRVLVSTEYLKTLYILYSEW
jgi:hypothetical protein